MGTILLFFEHQKGFSQTNTQDLFLRTTTDHFLLQRDALRPLLTTTTTKNRSFRTNLNVQGLGECGNLQWSPSFTFSLISQKYHILSFRTELWSAKQFDDNLEQATNTAQLYFESLMTLRPNVLALINDERVRYVRCQHADDLLAFCSFRDDFPHGVIPPKRKELQNETEHMLRSVRGKHPEHTRRNAIEFIGFSDDTYTSFIDELLTYFKDRWKSSQP